MLFKFIKKLFKFMKKIIVIKIDRAKTIVLEL